MIDDHIEISFCAVKLGVTPQNKVIAVQNKKLTQRLLGFSYRILEGILMIANQVEFSIAIINSVTKLNNMFIFLHTDFFYLTQFTHAFISFPEAENSIVTIRNNGKGKKFNSRFTRNVTAHIFDRSSICKSKMRCKYLSSHSFQCLQTGECT